MCRRRIRHRIRCVDSVDECILPGQQGRTNNFSGDIVPKQKTHKGMQKRFKITASGKAKHRKANRGHILGKKSGDRKRSLRNDGVVTGTVAKKIAEALRPGL